MDLEKIAGEEAWEQVPEANELTISQLTILCESFKAMKDKRKALEDEASEVGVEVAVLEKKILEYFQEYGMDQFRGSFGLISIKETSSVKQPSTLEAKREFFNYLKCQDVFEELVSVNSKTLNSWVSKEIEAKEKEGVLGWVPPGLEAPSKHTSLSLRKK